MRWASYGCVMTTHQEAHRRLEAAQQLLERSQADLATVDDFLTWLPEAIGRNRELLAYYNGPGQEHLTAILAADPSTVTPPVANEDAVWDVAADLDTRLLRLLRITTAELTAGLDEDTCEEGTC